MKELTIEQKAQRYDEAIKRAKSKIKNDKDHVLYKDDVIEIFPELSESEESKDERIRKGIIRNLEFLMDRAEGFVKNELKERIAWLEKQGEQKQELLTKEKALKNSPFVEQKPADKLKFKVGDFLVSDYCMGKVVELTNDAYLLDTEQGIPFSCEHNAHIWTIQDAKDGDVLCGYPEADYPWIGIFHKLNTEGTFSSYCFLRAGQHGKFCPPSGENVFGKRNVDNHKSKGIVPATQKQRDTLMKAMADAGYTFDFEKKELKKVEQKPNWSEEDEKLYNRICDLIHEAAFANCETDEVGKELGEYAKMIRLLKSLNNRVQLQSKQEWSEEDEKIYQSIMDDTVQENQLDDKQTNWLRDIKYRNQWKPSEEQMDAIRYVSNFDYGGHKAALVSLYEQLKKLRGE